MFAKLANKRKLDEATSAKDDVTPSESIVWCANVAVLASELMLAVLLQFTCWTRSLNLSVRVVTQLRAWQMPQ